MESTANSPPLPYLSFGAPNSSAPPTSDVTGNDSTIQSTSINSYRLPAPNQAPDVTEKLPVEIICEIFKKFIEDNSQPKDDMPDKLCKPHFCHSDPTVLGRICSRWRAAAISLRELWSNICIHNPKSSQIPLVNLRLERSANSPLCLTFDYNLKEDDIDLRAAAVILKSFISRLEYWRTIEFQIPFQLLNICEYIAACRLASTPMLQSCVFGFQPSGGRSYTPGAGFDPCVGAIWKVFYSSPNLRRVHWTGQGVYSLPSDAPFRQLTHVETAFTLSVDEVLSFLNAASLLLEEICIDTIRQPSETQPDSGTALRLPRLRVLIVHSQGDIAITYPLFSRLECPSLQILTLNYECRSRDPNLPELILFLQRSTCQLDTLKITNTELSDTDLELHLQSPTLQFLRCLWVYQKVISDNVIHLLMNKFGDGSDQVLPRLEKLFLGFCETTDGLLASMISSRWYDDGTSLGSLRWAMVTTRRAFGSSDNQFFTTHELKAPPLPLRFCGQYIQHANARLISK
ncbi:hypothetical protein M413DRAFT_29402 [Hebeloma cylindrosporum]|uniref:Uncharacterized protein n=1 Tax=Hebeloma cylindrosporum TaxID=76867 RepID=A0A0C2XNI3_HEBCY|nr:hypothetical protein M413DRAFT_29402 [Hebeloma cylindrosporum h7]